MLKLSKLLTLFGAMLLNTASLAQEVDTSDSEKYIAGTHYEVLSTPIRTQNPNKIEATEVFWYGCSHCYRFEPLVVEWAKKTTRRCLHGEEPRHLAPHDEIACPSILYRRGAGRPR